MEEYIKYYQSIDPENAELLYQRAVAAYVYDEQVKARAQYYSSMKPAKAAAIFCEMTGDLDIVAALLNSSLRKNAVKFWQRSAMWIPSTRQRSLRS